MSVFITASKRNAECLASQVEQVGGRALVLTIRHGIDDVCPTIPEPTQRVHDEILIGTFGELSERKGHKVLLEALAIASEARSDIQLKVVGSGVLWDELHAVRTELNIDERVSFLGFRSDWREVMAGVDCVVHPSLHGEDLPLVLLYARRLGLPIIASDVGGIEELVKDGESGKLLPPGSVDALAVVLGSLQVSDLTHWGLGSAASSAQIATIPESVALYDHLYSSLMN